MIMRTLILLALCTLALNIQTIMAKNDTIDKYVIDKEIIERFDGTQLEGKTISKYVIAYRQKGNVVEKTHVIFTNSKSALTENIGLKDAMNVTVYDGLIIVDGKEIDRKDLKNIIKTEDVASINYHKADSKVAKSYGEKGENGVLVIATKANKAFGNVYFINGGRADKSEVDKLSPDNIASMSINNKDGKTVVDIVTKK